MPSPSRPDGGRSSRARDWYDRGATFEWRDPEAAGRRAVDIFHFERGDPAAPVLLLVHGFPTSSIDWYDIVDRLAEHHRVVGIDFPGCGFSGKPGDWPYALETDARLLEHYVREVVGTDRCAVVAHDRGDSVSLLLHDRQQRSPEPANAVDHLVLTNGNIFLPLSSLTEFQRLVLAPASWEQVRARITPEALALGIGQSTFTPARGADDETIRALAETFAVNDGVAVLHRTIQYLRERADDEERWLGSLARSSVPTTMIWGICDTVSPPRVATHVWERYLRDKPGSNELWFLPGANHYLQHDRPDAFLEALTAALARPGAEAPAAPGALANDGRSAVRVDRSGAALPSAHDVLGS